MTALPYRPNVGGVLFNGDGRVFVARRTGLADAWQLPQGGIDKGETPDSAIIREMQEEIGTSRFSILASLADWLTYDFPAGLAAPIAQHWRGQRQMWFALRFEGDDSDIALDRDAHPEFDAWRWVRLSDVPSLAVPFKRPVYEVLVREFARLAAL